MNNIKYNIPKPSIVASAVICLGLFFSFGNLQQQMPHVLLQNTALLLGGSLLLSFFVEFIDHGFKGLIRLDIAALGSLYLLLFIEYVTLQPEVNNQTTSELIIPSIKVGLIGFLGITLGRHIISSSVLLPSFARKQARRQDIEFLLYISFVFGYAFMLYKVNFNPVELVNSMMGPRFSQPWTRGRFGDLSALLYEIGMMKMILPPLAGFILAQPHRVSSKARTFSLFILLFTLFYGFTSGTRNLLASQLITFMAAFAFFSTKQKRPMVVGVLTACTLFMLFSINVQLEFRKIGLTRYLNGERSIYMESVDNIKVDNNIVVLAELVNFVPAQVDYFGLEVPYLALIRPIPRAIWKSKPMGLDVSIEEIYGTKEKGLGSTTLATTFLGEAYLSAGPFGSFIAALLLGIFCTWGNRFASIFASEMGIIMFSMLFFVVSISTRSLFSFTPALLPFIAICLYAKYFIKPPRQNPSSRKTINAQP